MNDLFPDIETHLTRLQRFKVENLIETNDNGAVGDPERWIACHMPTGWEAARAYIKPQCDLFDLFMDACRILDDANIIGYGATEREAIENLCVKIGI